MAEYFLLRPNVTQEGKGFGSSALRVGGRIFAMLTSRSEFVVKLSRARVDELIHSGDGVRYAGSGGRPLKEWVVIRPESSASWQSLADEALTFCLASLATTRPRASQSE
ncbi:MAG: hypothetical protein JO352_23855 [Chloroflexi bacterium]|nr:hypothetical protein [Chloroflexota bacterium]MBV9597216.1 hypothetical protein [Chloroflexota bacterium]